MQMKQGNMLQSLRNVQAFLDDNTAALDAVVQTGECRRLDDAITQLATHASDQDASHIASQGSTRQQGALRTVLLRDHMSPLLVSPGPIFRTHRRSSHSACQGAPQYGAPVHRGTRHGQGGRPFAPVFIAAGLPSDFVAQLNTAADAMIAAVGDSVQSRGKRSGVTKGLADKLTEGRKVIHILDAFVKTSLKSDPPLLANWEQVKRVQRVRARTTATTSSTPAPHAHTHAHADADAVHGAGLSHRQPPDATAHKCQPYGPSFRSS
ncbi:MAG: hypothetical protein M3Z05_20020 [Gemmatimonadota bacterium]|nr:hypothetical protein [Gemmatimonadota bacterium]